jgi:hypothetical protein
MTEEQLLVRSEGSNGTESPDTSVDPNKILLNFIIVTALRWNKQKKKERKKQTNKQTNKLTN